MLKSSDLNLKINQEISRSFQNVNYSQWERQVKQPNPSHSIKKSERQTSATVRARPSSINLKDSNNGNNEVTERKTFQNPRGKIVFKSRKQQVEEEARRNLLKAKIKFQKENIMVLNDRANELTEINLDIIEYIDKTENSANDKVDSILRKYERYQDVLKTINKKHSEEITDQKKDQNSIKKESKTELPKYEKISNEIEHELKSAQDLNKQLSIYKNQEYPEKILQINNLRKNLDDFKKFQYEEKEAFIQMMHDDKEREKAGHLKLTENIANNITEKVVDEMHYSLKEMALDNESMKSEIQFFKNLMEELYEETNLLEKELLILKSDRRVNNRAVIFNDIFKEKKICSPDMDIVLDLPKNELY